LIKPVQNDVAVNVGSDNEEYNYKGSTSGFNPRIICYILFTAAGTLSIPGRMRAITPNAVIAGMDRLKRLDSKGGSLR